MSCDDTFRQLNDLNKALADPFRTGETIYHYTSAEGLRGIVARGEIWLTNTAFVNDTTECRAFWSLTRDEVLGSGSFPNKYVEKCWEWMKRCQPVDNHYYVASFSKVNDSLQQFRAYGSFCIGFDASRLVKTRFLLHNCLYDTPAIKDWIRQKSCIEQWEGDCLDDMAKDAGAHNLLFAASVKYKNTHYEAEQEVRLISVSYHDLRDLNRRCMSENMAPIHFRDHRAYGLPVPFVKFFLTDGAYEDCRSELLAAETPMATRMRRLKKEEGQSRGLLPVTRICLGPMVRQEEAKIACEILLQAKGYEHVVVDPLDIPYRGP